uniref:Metaxin glutathione S-transferase domain-containing protein n=1 Tax=Arcella intermedia TaxID=1963864 RepID=A0A6B2LD79_9EUKA
MKLSGVPFVEVAASKSHSPSKILPVISINHGKVISNGPLHIIDFLKKMGYLLPAEKGLSELQLADSYSLTSLILYKFLKYHQFNWWMEKDNYEGFTKIIYEEDKWNWDLPAPKTISSNLQEEGYTLNKIDQIYEDTDQCLKVLSTKLGKNKYFMGMGPTTVDCVAYAFFSIHLFSSLPNKSISELISKYQNLVQFTHNMAFLVYTTNHKNPAPLTAYLNKKKNKETSEQKKKKENEYALHIFLGLTALTLFRGYLYTVIQALN